MKKIFLVLIVFFMLAGGAFAQTTNTESSAFAISAPNISNQNEIGAVAVIQSSPNYLQSQPIYPYLLQMIPGVIADVTKEMPLYDVIKPLTTEKIVKAVTFNGTIFNRIRMEDVEQEVMDHIQGVMNKFGVTSTERIRYKVRFKMSSRTVGSGGGAGGSMAGFGGGMNPLAYGSNASIMPGIAVNTADPQFIISYYLVSLASAKMVAFDEKYIEQGWKKVEAR